MVFLRFSKGAFKSDTKNYIRTCKRAVFLDNTLVMYHDEKLVGIAKLHEENDKFMDFDIVVANKCPIGGNHLAEDIKSIIVKSNKYSNNPTTKKRKYYVEMVDCAELPIKVSISLTALK